MSDAPPPPPPPSGAPDPEPSKPGLGSRAWTTVRSWPTSAKVTTAVLFVLFIAAAASGGSESDPEVEATASEETTTTTEEEVEETTTTEKATTTTTTTTAPTLSPEEERELAVLGMGAAFDAERANLAEVLNGLTDVETVDRMAFENETVIIDVTSGWASPDNQHDGAWSIMKALSQFWEPNEGIWWQENFVPALQFINSGRNYTCPGDFMVQMANLGAGRDQWESTCA